LRVIWVAQVADALTDDLHLVRVLEQPPDGCAFNHFRIAQVRKKSPRRCWLAAVEPANQDKWAIVDHGAKFTSAQALRLVGNVKMLNPLRREARTPSWADRSDGSGRRRHARDAAQTRGHRFDYVLADKPP
jgi:hypothetical protein